MARSPRPRCQHLLRKFKNTFLPSVSNEQITVKSIWMHHQGPAHFASSSCDWLDVLFIDCINARPILRKVVLESQATLDKSVHLRLEELEVIQSDAPSGLG